MLSVFSSLACSSYFHSSAVSSRERKQSGILGFSVLSFSSGAARKEAGTFGATRREREIVKRITRESKQARFHLCDVSLLARGARPAPLNGSSNEDHRIRLDCGRGLQLIASLRSSITCVIRHVTISAIRKRDVPRPLASFDRRAD